MATTRSTFQLKNVDTTAGGWTAIASTPSTDRDGEVVDAFAFTPLPASVPTHADHSFAVADLVGRATPYYDALGVLHVDGVFAGTTKAQEIRGLVSGGLIGSMSVAFITASRTVDSRGVRHVTKAELVAVDFVTVPANGDARVLSTRSLTGDTMRLPGRRAKADADTWEARFRERQEQILKSASSAVLAPPVQRGTVHVWRGRNLDGWPWTPMQKDLDAIVAPSDDPRASTKVEYVGFSKDRYELDPITRMPRTIVAPDAGPEDEAPHPLGRYDTYTGLRLDKEGDAPEIARIDELERRIEELRRQRRTGVGE